MNFIGISKARSNLPNIVKKVGDNLDRFFITVRGIPRAVVISPEELESLEETAEILAIPGARKSIKEGLEDVKKGRLIPLSELADK